MFFVNWIASSYFRKLKINLSPSTGDEKRFVLEESTLTEQEFSEDELAKLEVVKCIWRRVGKALGVSHPRGVHLAVQSKGLETSVAMWHCGAPTIVIPRDYLSRLITPIGLQEKDFNAREWAVWTRFIDQSPDHLPDMITYAERFSKKLPKKQLFSLADRYCRYLSPSEFEAELAHEFGHVQAEHLNPCRSSRFMRWLSRFCYGTIPLVTALSITFMTLFGRRFTHFSDFVLPTLCGFAAFVLCRRWFADKLMQNTLGYIRRQWEKEADLIAASAKRFCEGNIRLYKKDILMHIIREKNIEAVRQKVLSCSEHHPSDGERLHFFIKKLRKYKEKLDEEGNQAPSDCRKLENAQNPSGG